MTRSSSSTKYGRWCRSETPWLVTPYKGCEHAIALTGVGMSNKLGWDDILVVAGAIIATVVPAAWVARKVVVDIKYVTGKRKELCLAVKNGELVFIDSNIWMNPAYELSLKRLITQLEADGAVMHMDGAQFNEIDRLRKRNKGAQHAIRLIDQLIKKPSLSIGDRHRKYVDKHVSVLAKERLASGGKVVVVTNDIPMRIEMEEMGKPFPERMQVIKGDEFKTWFEA